MSGLLSRISQTFTQKFSLGHLASSVAAGVPGSLLAKQIAEGIQTFEHGLEQSLGVYGGALAGTTTEELMLALIESVLVVGACAAWYFTAPLRHKMAKQFATAVAAGAIMTASVPRAPDVIFNDRPRYEEAHHRAKALPPPSTISFHYRLG